MLQKRLKCKQLEEKNTMQIELKINSYKVDNGLNVDFIEIINSNLWKMTPFMKFFWEQQKFNLVFIYSSSWARYHPMIVRFCSSVAQNRVLFTWAT